MTVDILRRMIATLFVALATTTLLAGCASPGDTEQNENATTTESGGDDGESADAITWPTKKEPAPVRLSGPTDGPLRLSLTTTNTTVALGGTIEVEATLRNTGDETIRIKELVHDTQSLSFAMVWNQSTSFEFEKLVHWNMLPREWEVVDLAPGDGVTETFSIPTLVTGAVQVGGRFRGVDAAPEDAEPLRSNVLEIQVDPAEGGADQLVARLKTNFGDIVIGFWPGDAPNTSLHFVELVHKSFYDDVSFHRMIPQFMLQGGDPVGNGTGDAGYFLRAEFNERKHVETVVSMARSEDPDSAGCQFFICLAEAPHLDTLYTGFGEVVEGFTETVRKIEAEAELYEDPYDKLYDDVYIEKATIETRAAAP